MALKRIHIFVEGRVQGVCFRYYTDIEATNLQLTGMVRNLPDGRVEVIAEGDESALMKLLDFCRKGPSMAFVSDLQYELEEYSGSYSNFSISR